MSLTKGGVTLSGMHKGIAVSPGVAVGTVHRVESVYAPAEPEYLASDADLAAEEARFDHAVSLAAAELELMVQKIAEQVGRMRHRSSPAI